MSALGNKIKSIRKEKGISISQLSKESGVGRSTISEIETGKALNPKIETLSNISSVLGVSVNELLTCDEKLNLTYNMVSEMQNIAESALGYATKDLENSIYAITTKYDSEAFSKEEQKEISDFIDFIISKRKK